MSDLASSIAVKLIGPISKSFQDNMSVKCMARFI